MTRVKAAGCVVLGALLAALFLYPFLARREQRWGLLMTPEDVKTSCGIPQTDNIYDLKYVQNDSQLELRFFEANHSMFLQHVKWSSSHGSGDINQVTLDGINQYVENGGLPRCLAQAAK
jgi:hypothetical protein